MAWHEAYRLIICVAENEPEAIGKSGQSGKEPDSESQDSCYTASSCDSNELSDTKVDEEDGEGENIGTYTSDTYSDCVQRYYPTGAHWHIRWRCFPHHFKGAYAERY
jgi:hypothetical protein